MLLSGQVTHRTNSSQLFSNGLSQKKKTNRRGQGEDWGHTFLEKKPWNCFGISLYPCKFQVKQNLTPKNLVKLCYIPRKFRCHFVPSCNASGGVMSFHHCQTFYPPVYLCSFWPLTFSVKSDCDKISLVTSLHKDFFSKSLMEKFIFCAVLL